ncbi:hypothetical protein LOTGIDRAFT_236761 [Lottia gigantea]|uniref:Schlafen AlbA-2 domain-containing protein n=1 Tax=Lottia gigantea TaxID=225164 RepID=V3ZL76_LOTGI|nr:hypothetical protein LOTGIDRAFT_236761 [Lottia gigantea]ESO83160.1 hypothetical protein LOTGIDRAFT_236761 [Lottia gigantea]
MGRPRRANHGLFINGLRCDIPSGELKEFLFDLLDDLNIPIKKSYIKILPQKDKKIAFVDLMNEGNTAEALKHLGSEKKRNRLAVDFDFYANDNDFCIRRINPNYGADSDIRFGNNNNGLKAEHGSSSNIYHGVSAQSIPESNRGNARLITIDKGISVQSFAARPTNKDVMFMKGKPLDAATSVSGLMPVVQRKFYHYNEILGSETRVVEFKEGKGNYKNKTLGEHVGMYVCGFANTQEGGTLFMGVTDRGQAQGITCNHAEEDQIRLRIDEAVKSIEPPILPNMYSVAFSPVLCTGTFSDNLKVIEVCVHPGESHEELYEFQGKVYVRRDGSVQNFKLKDIKEWARQKAAKERALSSSIEQQLDVVTLQLQEIQTHIQNNPRSKKKKSKTCAIL